MHVGGGDLTLEMKVKYVRGGQLLAAAGAGVCNRNEGDPSLEDAARM
jgi:hypothetical protein